MKQENMEKRELRRHNPKRNKDEILCEIPAPSSRHSRLVWDPIFKNNELIYFVKEDKSI